MKHLRKFIQKAPLLLLLIIFVGGTLRFYNLNWDNYLIFHPDERNIANAVSRINFFTQLNPGFFAYGGLPIYLYTAAGNILNAATHSNVWTFDWGHINLVGRTFSAFFSTLTIVFVYALGKRLFDKKTGILAACIFAFTVSSIQIAHFATTESFIILIATILTYLSVLICEKPTLFRFIIAGGVLGLGLAAKTTAISFSLILITAFIVTLANVHGKKALSILANMLALGVTSLVTFTLFSPYTFLAWNKFTESMNYESGVASGKLAVPYTHQFDKAIPYLFELVNMFWQMGPIFVFSFVGFFIVTYFAFKKRHAEYLIILFFPLLYFIYVGSWHAKFERYMTPLLPFFALYAAFILLWVYKNNKWIGRILIMLALGLTIFWAFAFETIYTRPQTRAEASVWMYKHIKPTDKVYTEHWDDGLPIHIDGIDKTIPTEQLTIYDNEFNNKAGYYAEKLSSGDYVILVTRRLYGTLQYLPSQYPVTSRYYKSLFSGQLGYKRVAEFSSYPSLLGITINDDASEESFQVYEHPKILIFKNVKSLPQNQLLKILKTK